jgi:type II restriction enzyme
MDRIPEAGKVFYVKNGQAQNKSAVMEAWERTTFLRQTSFEARGWALEILRNIQSLNAREFTIDAMYSFEAELKQRFPRNKFIRPQIRKQLQILRDAGIIVFRGRGRYALAPDPATETPQERHAPYEK